MYESLLLMPIIRPEYPVRVRPTIELEEIHSSIISDGSEDMTYGKTARGASSPATG